MSVIDSTTNGRKRVKIERGIYARDGKFHVLVSEGGRVTFETFHNITAARARRGEILKKRHAGEAVMPSAKLTVAKAIEKFFAQARIKPSTRALYVANLNRPEVKRLHSRKLASVTVDDIAKLVRKLESHGLAGSTIRNVLIPLSSVCTLGVWRGWMTANPVAGLTRSERPQVTKYRHRILSSAEIKRVLLAAGELRMLITVAVFTGLRQSELLGLRWSDVDLDGARLHVRAQLDRKTHERVEPKTREAVREIPLPAFLVQALREHRVASGRSLDHDPLFTTASGEVLDHRNLVRAWHVIRKRAGLVDPQPRFHDLRHTAASLWISEGADVVYVSRVLGHASPSITLDVYAGLFDRARHEERVTTALNAAFGGMV